MKNYKRLTGVIICLIISLAMLSGCFGAAFSFSKDIDENGYWKGVKAADYVEMFDYKKLSIPAEAHTVSDADLQTQIDQILEQYSTVEKKITDRAVIDGDTVNIDYVGSVGGVEFSGGSTGGQGADVTIGVTQYIDDFLQQLIGHKPGETINIEVTFPDPYTNNPDLAGKDAVFVTTINHIVDTESTENVDVKLTDEFVEENLLGTYGWKTVAEMKEKLRENLEKNAIQNYILDYIETKVTVKSIPEKIAKHQEDVYIKKYKDYAFNNSIPLEQVLTDNAGVSTVEELLENGSEDNLKETTYFLVCQAIAEDMKLLISDKDVEEYFGTSDYSQQEEQYGKPYIKMRILCEKVVQYICDNAVLA